jgi:hypothetical protein
VLVIYFLNFVGILSYRASEGRLPERTTNFQNLFNTSSEVPADVEYMEEAVLFKSG